MPEAAWIALYVLGWIISIVPIARWYRSPPAPYSPQSSVACGLLLGLFWPAAALFAGVCLLTKWLTPLIFPKG